MREALLLVLVGAWVLELTIGDPVSPWHPVALYGRAVGAAVRRVPRSPPGRALLGGAVVVIVAVTGVALGSALVLRSVEEWSPWAAIVLGALLGKASFSYRQLEREVTRVATALQIGAVNIARVRLRALVSRDSSNLPPKLVASAAIESLAENLSDSLVAPVLYLVLFGVPGALAYRAINTLDAMIGYHGEFEYVGRVAARLDDLANLVPARLTALLLLIAMLLVGRDWRGAARVAAQQHGNTASPNAGWPMATMAGGLAIQLEKAGHHQLGVPRYALDYRMVGQAVRVARCVAVLVVVFALLALAVRRG